MKRTLLLSLLTMSLSTAPALAASPSATGYDETGANEVLQVLGASESNPPAAGGTNGASGTAGVTAEVAAPTEAGEVSSSSLPFTGLDVGIVLLAGAALLGVGLVMRRTARPRTTQL